MDVLHTARMPWGESLVAQRGGGDVAHKRLFEGDEDSPDNYMLVMSKEPCTYFSPRHRHPWDQIRYSLEGRIPIAKGLYVKGGELGYFPESAHYGPQEGGDDRKVLLLQFGGASGQGFIGPDRLKQARIELAKEGRFEGGVYHRDVAEGRRNRDAYEAIWLHARGGELDYAPAAYSTPVVMRPEALPWRPTTHPGIARRQIGVFPHRGLTLDAWQLQPGAVLSLHATPALQLLFVLSGHGRIGSEALEPWSAVRLVSGERAELTATTEPLQLMQWSVSRVADLALPLR
ncbi:MAG: hypothetical protein RL026_840 [Pseudomonadota bacterium]|jgi:quercetin dioxygenase-like cupin family protein